jgi:hypothetical protein
LSFDTTRASSTTVSVSMAIKQVDGKRLEYRESVDNPPYLVQTEQPKAPF